MLTNDKRTVTNVVKFLSDFIYGGQKPTGTLRVFSLQNPTKWCS